MKPPPPRPVPPPPPPQRRAAPPPPPPPPSAKSAGVAKGRLLADATTAIPPWNPAIGYGFGAAIGVLLVCIGLAMRSRSHDGVVFATMGILACLGVLLAVFAARIPRAVKVWEHGLEVPVSRNFRASRWLPWSALTKYEWQDDVLCYAWEPGRILVLRNGRQHGRPRKGPFPRAARVPWGLIADVTAALHRHAPPPGR